MEQEIWRDVVSYEGAYRVSNYGNIKSIERFIVRKNGSIIPIKERILKFCLNKKTGYFHVSLSGKVKTIHIIVSEAFLGFKQCNGKLCINHIDGDKHNNNLSNLEIVTQRYNVSVGLRTKNKTSEYLGVSFHNGHKKWRAEIRHLKDCKTIGYFDSEIEASNAYQKALKHILDNGVIPNNEIKTISKYRGVSYNNNKWFSYFDETPNIRHFLGYVKTEKEALENLINKHLKYINL